MSETLTLNLPETLAQNLRAQARQAGVTLDELIVSALLRVSTPAYTVHELSEEEIRRQEEQRAALRQRLGRVSIEEARRILETREQVEPEADLDPVAAAQLRSVLWQSPQPEERLQ